MGDLAVGVHTMGDWAMGVQSAGDWAIGLHTVGDLGALQFKLALLSTVLS